MMENEKKGVVKLQRNSLLAPFLIHVAPSSPSPKKPGTPKPLTKSQLGPLLEGAPVTMATDPANQALVLEAPHLPAPIRISLRYVFGAHVVTKQPGAFAIHLFFPKWLAPPASLRDKNLPLVVVSQDPGEAQAWVDVILRLTFPLGKRRILLVLNPFGGAGKASELFHKYAEPMLKDAHVTFELMESQYAGHAIEIGKKIELKNYDVIATISGDGLLHELINGLMSRADLADAADLSLAIIPAGSGNALALSFQIETVLSATFNVIKSPNRKIDLLSTTIEGKRRFSHLSLTYGLIADADYESESFRWAGSERFTISAVIRLLNLRRYPLRLSVLPSPVSGEDSWEVLEGDFVYVSILNAPYISKELCAAPFSDLSDGLVDVTFIQNPPQGDLISLFLSDMSTGESFATHPLVQHRQARAVHLEPLEKKGNMMLDGERIALEPIKIEVHPKIVSFVAPEEVSFPVVQKS